MLGRLGREGIPPFITWDWPWHEEDLTGVVLLERVAADYAAADVVLPMGGHVGGSPYLLPSERLETPQ